MCRYGLTRIEQTVVSCGAMAGKAVVVEIHNFGHNHVPRPLNVLWAAVISRLRRRPDTGPVNVDYIYPQPFDPPHVGTYVV